MRSLFRIYTSFLSAHMYQIYRLCFGILIGGLIALCGTLGVSWIDTPHSHAQGRFGTVLEESVNTGDDELPDPLITYLQKPNNSSLSGDQNLRDFIVNVVVNLVIPILVFVGIIFAIIGFYKLFFDETDGSQQQAFNYIIYGVLGIILMMSAGYITNMLFGAEGLQGTVFNFQPGASIVTDAFNGPQIAEQLYTVIAYPFLQLFLGIMIGILFILVVFNLFKYLFSPDDAIQDKALSIILYAAVGIIIIILARSIVEFVYGSYDSVVDTITDLSQVGEPLFSGDINDRFATLRLVLNRVLGIATFLVVIIIIYLGYMLLFAPTSEDRIKDIKNYIIYLLIGIFVIGAAYIISRMLLVTEA